MHIRVLFSFLLTPFLVFSSCHSPPFPHAKDESELRPAGDLKVVCICDKIRLCHNAKSLHAIEACLIANKFHLYGDLRHCGYPTIQCRGEACRRRRTYEGEERHQVENGQEKQGG